MDAGEAAELGLYDLAADHAALRLELIGYLESLGATPEDLVAYRANLPGLALALGIRGGPVLTVAEAAERAGVSVDELRRLSRITGIADPGPEAAVYTAGFADIVGMLSGVSAFMGEEANLQLLRVLGAAMARVADTAVSLFLVNVEPAARREDPAGIAIARANAEAAELVSLMAPVLDALFRQHLLAAQRTTGNAGEQSVYETRLLAVGFADLVGSTELGEELSLTELGALIAKFEHLASDLITEGGGRLVKLIGDGVLFTAPDAASAARIALDLSEAVRADTRLPELRVGLHSGAVVLRDGDVFGPVVNLAARIIAAAAPGEVLASAALADASGLHSDDRGAHGLKGIAEPVELRRLLGS